MRWLWTVASGPPEGLLPALFAPARTERQGAAVTAPVLLPLHREQLHGSGWTDATIEASGVYSATDPADGGEQ